MSLGTVMCVRGEEVTPTGLGEGREGETGASQRLGGPAQEGQLSSVSHGA